MTRIIYRHFFLFHRQMIATHARTRWLWRVAMTKKQESTKFMQLHVYLFFL